MQYVALQMMLAKAVGLNPGKFTVFTQNMHIYDRHIPAAKELLERTPTDCEPKLIFNPKSDDFYSFTVGDFELVDYKPVYPQIKLQVAV